MVTALKTLSTRGEWKSGELKYVVLLTLRQRERDVELGARPLLSAKGIAILTGASFRSLKTLLPRWCRCHVIRREDMGIKQKYHRKVYGYSITKRGLVCFEMKHEGYISKRALKVMANGRPTGQRRVKGIVIDTKAMIQRLLIIRMGLPDRGIWVI